MKISTNIWDKESLSYQFSKDQQPDYLADFFYIKKNLGKVKGKKILEVGCGSGITSAYLASLGAKLHLVDNSEKSLSFAKRYFRKKGLNANYYFMDAFNMNFPEKHFDCVWNGGVIEHYDDFNKIKMIQKMWSLVKPGGTLYISVPHARDIVFMIASSILKIRHKWMFGKEDDLTKKRLSKLFRSAGIVDFITFSYNPIVGWWFFPFGKEVSSLLGLNSVKYHKKISNLGHVLVICAKKK